MSSRKRVPRVFFMTLGGVERSSLKEGWAGCWVELGTALPTYSKFLDGEELGFGVGVTYIRHFDTTQGSSEPHVLGDL